MPQKRSVSQQEMAAHLGYGPKASIAENNIRANMRDIENHRLSGKPISHKAFAGSDGRKALSRLLAIDRATSKGKKGFR